MKIKSLHIDGFGALVNYSLNFNDELNSYFLNNGEEVKVVGFGKFMVKQRLPRNVINPANKEVMTLPKQKAITFRPAKQAKTFVNK